VCVCVFVLSGGFWCSLKVSLVEESVRLSLSIISLTRPLFVLPSFVYRGIPITSITPFLFLLCIPAPPGPPLGILPPRALGHPVAFSPERTPSPVRHLTSVHKSPFGPFGTTTYSASKGTTGVMQSGTVHSIHYESSTGGHNLTTPPSSRLMFDNNS
jgi:hypothetical protein